MVFAPDAFLADFAVDVTINGVPARGIFDNAYAEAFSGMVSGSSPVLVVASSVAVQRGQPVVIGSAGYTVTSVEPDGTGITLLRLAES